VLALVSWLYNCEVERAFAKARTAGSELSEQKAAFKLKIKKRTKELRQSQLEEMRQMYRCAELGQYGVTLLHDLANHLTALNLEIEGLDSKQHAETIARAQRIIQHLGEVVDSTRDRLHGGVRTQTFNVVQKTSEVVRFLQYKASRADVAIDWQPPAENWEYTGDAACFNQVLNILIGNAIDAYDTVRGPGRVRVVLERDAQKLRVSVCDWGKGIPGPKRRQLFKPVRSTKEAGFGIGLFIAKQAVEMHFSGTIRLNPSLDYTEFIISLPRSIPKTNVPIANSKMNLIAQ
jgi:signal transduction histidine kinase